VNCNLCEMICPDFAIFSVPVLDGEVEGKAGGASQPGKEA